MRSRRKASYQRKTLHISAEFGGDDSSNKRSIHAVVARGLADLRANLGQGLVEFHSFKLPLTIGKEGKAGAGLAQRVSLLPDCDVDSSLKHCVRSYETPNSSSRMSLAAEIAKPGFLAFPQSLP